MGNNESQSKEEGALLKRLQSLETKIKEHDETQKMLRWISLTGILAILTCFGIFLYRLYDYGKNYQYQVLAQKVAAESVNIIRPEAEIFIRELRDDLVPEFTKKLSSEINKSMPVIKSKALDLSEDLKVQVRKQAEERLLESMISSLENSADDIKNVFPEFTPEDLERQIGQSMGFYVERLHQVIEERLAFITSSLEGLKNSTEKLKESEQFSELMPDSVNQAEEQLIDALMEIVVYEIRTELGNQPAHNN